MNLDEYLEKNEISHYNKDDHSKLVDQIFRSPNLIGIFELDRIFGNIQLFNEIKTFGQIDLIIKSMGEYHVITAKVIQSRNADITERRRLMKRDLEVAYNYFKEVHKTLVYMTGIYSCAGSSKLESFDIPRDSSDILDFIRKGIMAW